MDKIGKIVRCIANFVQSLLCALLTYTNLFVAMDESCMCEPPLAGCTVQSLPRGA